MLSHGKERLTIFIARIWAIKIFCKNFFFVLYSGTSIQYTIISYKNIIKHDTQVEYSVEI